MSISTDLSTLSLTDLSTLPLDTLLSKASFHLPHEPYLAIPYLNQALVLDTSSAPLHAQRAHAYVFLGDWAKAYFDACQGLDEYAEGLTDDLRAELVGLAGRCAVERAIWDLAVIVRPLLDSMCIYAYVHVDVMFHLAFRRGDWSETNTCHGGTTSQGAIESPKGQSVPASVETIAGEEDQVSGGGFPWDRGGRGVGE